MSKDHYVKRPLYQTTILTNDHCFKGPLCQMTIIWNDHYVARKLCQTAIMSNAHYIMSNPLYYVKQPLVQKTIMSNDHHVKWPLFQTTIMSNDYYVKWPFFHTTLRRCKRREGHFDQTVLAVLENKTSSTRLQTHFTRLFFANDWNYLFDPVKRDSSCLIAWFNIFEHIFLINHATKKIIQISCS